MIVFNAFQPLSREGSNKLNHPKPIDTRDIIILPELLELLEQLAENAHDIWAMNRLRQGWTYGPQRNDLTKQHPDLVPYTYLSESEKGYDRATVVQTIKAVMALGYKIEKY